MQRGFSGGTDDSFEFHHHRRRRGGGRKKPRALQMLIIKAERTVDRHRRHRNKNNRRGTVSDALPVVVLRCFHCKAGSEKKKNADGGGVLVACKLALGIWHANYTLEHSEQELPPPLSVCLATQELCADVTKVSGSYNHLQRFPLRGSVVNATLFMAAV